MNYSLREQAGVISGLTVTTIVLVAIIAASNWQPGLVNDFDSPYAAVVQEIDGTLPSGLASQLVEETPELAVAGGFVPVEVQGRSTEPPVNAEGLITGEPASSLGADAPVVVPVGADPGGVGGQPGTPGGTSGSPPGTTPPPTTTPTPTPTTTTSPTPPPRGGDDDPTGGPTQTGTSDPDPDPTTTGTSDPDPDPTTTVEPPPDPTTTVEPPPDPTTTSEPPPDPTSTSEPPPDPTTTTDPIPDPSITVTVSAELPIIGPSGP